MKSLERDVTVREMMTLRQEGWSNYEIAEKLGCCYATVLKYIGSQPKGIRGERLYTIPKKIAVQTADSDNNGDFMDIKEMTVKGKSTSIKINFESQKVTLINGSGEITIPMQFLSSLADDVKLAVKVGEKFGGEFDGPDRQA